MAKLTLTDGTIFEGTTEEIFAITERFNGVKADEPEAEAPYEFKVGDRVEITNFFDSRYQDLDNGDIGEITQVDAFVDTPIRVRTDDDYDYLSASALRKVVDKPKAETLRVGDYAKVLVKENSYNGLHEVGAIVGITKVDSSDVPYQAVGLDGKESRWFKAKHIVKATDKEVAEAKALAEQSAKEAIFTQAGRNPNEYRKGDIVRADKALCGDCDGMVGVVEDVGENAIGVRFYGGLNSYRAVMFDGGGKATLIATVESRLDRN